MELAKSTDTAEQPWQDGLARSADCADAVSTVDRDLARAWEITAALRWVRNDHGPVNELRWLLWDKYGLGRPPSIVDQRPTADDATVVMHDIASTAPVLRLVTFEGGNSRQIESVDAHAPLGVFGNS
jgi:hypothetical protein